MFIWKWAFIRSFTVSKRIGLHHSLQDAVSASVVYCTNAFLLGLLWFQSVTFGTCIGSSRKYPHPPWSVTGHSEGGLGGLLKDKSFVKSKSRALTEIFRGVGGEELKPQTPNKTTQYSFQVFIC